MKIALVHELLTMKGGAEKVLRIVADMFPDAPIYTLLYDEAKLGDWFPKEQVKTSSIQKLVERWPLKSEVWSLKSLRFNHHLFLSRFSRAVESWDFSEFDLVLSSSSAFAHGIITNGTPKHLCYVHSPARYLWDRTHDVMERAGQGLIGPLRRAYLSRTFHRLRTWDAEAADRPDRLIAASQTVQRRIELYWRRDSTVIYPPIDDVWLDNEACHSEPVEERHAAQTCLVRQAHHDTFAQPYFFLASTLVPYKRLDLAIAAANRLQVPLVIAGEGPDRARLEKMAGPTVTFLGYVEQERLRELYAGASATIFPGDEDFGLVPLESLACGTPVIAFRSGGARETLDEDTAVFFDTPAAEALAAAMEESRRRTFSPQTCRARAQTFNRQRFEEGIRREVASLVRQK